MPTKDKTPSRRRNVTARVAARVKPKTLARLRRKRLPTSDTALERFKKDKDCFVGLIKSLHKDPNRALAMLCRMLDLSAPYVVANEPKVYLTKHKSWYRATVFVAVKNSHIDEVRQLVDSDEVLRRLDR